MEDRKVIAFRMTSCRRNEDCKYRSNMHCDEVIRQCEPCYKHACHKQKHTHGAECCKKCPEYAVKQMHYQCKFADERTEVNITSTSTTRNKLTGIPHKARAPPAPKQIALTSTLPSKIYIGQTAPIIGGPVVVSATNPWLYATLVLAVTFILLVIVVVFFLFYSMKRRSKKDISKFSDDQEAARGTELQYLNSGGSCEEQNFHNSSNPGEVTVHGNQSPSTCSNQNSNHDSNQSSSTRSNSNQGSMQGGSDISRSGTASENFYGPSPGEK